jgi:PilZ domain-containing protein
MVTPVPTRRSERRIPKILAAELSCADESVPKEVTFTQNVSPQGVRVTTVQRWQTGTRVLVTLLRNGVRSQGRIAYCERVESGKFALGLELVAVTTQRRVKHPVSL